MKSAAFLIESLEPIARDPNTYWRQALEAFGMFHPAEARILDELMIFVLLDPARVEEAVARHSRLVFSPSHHLRLIPLDPPGSPKRVFSFNNDQLTAENFTDLEALTRMSTLVHDLAHRFGTEIVAAPNPLEGHDDDFEAELQAMDRRMAMRRGDIRSKSHPATDEELARWGADRMLE